MRRLAKLAAVLPFLVLACSATGSSKDADKNGRPGGPQGAAGGDVVGDDERDFDDDYDGDGEDDPASAIAQLKGRVYAPEGTIPIAGALVYLSPTPPPDIPDGAYCDRCVELDKSIAYTFTAPSGQFVLGARRTGDQYLVVQKGQFRRVRSINVVEGPQDVAKEHTTFPNKTSKAYGDTIPKMAILPFQWDGIDVLLAKLGLGSITKDLFGVDQVDKSKYHGFDYIDNFAATKFVEDAKEMSKYHIIFKPCADSEQTTCKTYSPADKAPVQKALQEYVKGGGKFYATDYSYEYVRRVWPEYINWMGEKKETGSACNGGGVDGPAEVPDPGLGTWLEAMGHSEWDIHGSWTGISKVNAVNTLDVDGNPATITPKVWVKSKTTGKPATVSFESGCGRVLFSSYHAEVKEKEAVPQEMALLYVLLEVGVCVAPPVVK